MCIYSSVSISSEQELPLYKQYSDQIEEINTVLLEYFNL